MTEQRTYGWYARNNINHITHEPYPVNIDLEPANAPSGRTNLENLTDFGIVDLVPDLTNLVTVFERLAQGEPTPYDWRERPIGKGRVSETLKWILVDILEDPTLDPDIIRLFYRTNPENYVTCVVAHPRCPEDIILDLLGRSGTKGDTTRQTNGGEIACFVLHNRDLPGHLVDACARAMKKATNQKDVIVHKNVTRETLVYLVNHGRTDAVKQDALWAMFRKGWVTVK